MAQISGKSGHVTITAVEAPDMTKWSIGQSVNIKAQATNSTAGWKERIAGVADASGSMSIVQASAAASPLTPGSTFAAVFDIDGTAANTYTGTIMIESFDGYEVNMDDGGEVIATYKWGAHGALVAAGNVPPLTV